MAGRLGSGIDSPTLGHRFEVGQVHAVQSRAAARDTGLPTVTNAGADVESGADGPVVAATRQRLRPRPVTSEGTPGRGPSGRRSYGADPVNQRASQPVN
jgi:hypothetical protein